MLNWAGFVIVSHDNGLASELICTFKKYGNDKEACKGEQSFRELWDTRFFFFKGKGKAYMSELPFNQLNKTVKAQVTGYYKERALS